MELTNGEVKMDIRTGDKIVTHSGTFLIISSEGFNLFNDDGDKVNVILVNVENGSMEGYDQSIDDLWKYYSIKEVIQNPNSYERLNRLS